jgi:hypothetical protein
MAFDATQHTTDAAGFLIDKKTGRRVGLENTPLPASPKDQEYPKYVPVHSSQIDRTHGHVSTPGWPNFTIDRATKAVMVAVKDAEEAARAAADMNAPKPPAEFDHSAS